MQRARRPTSTACLPFVEQVGRDPRRCDVVAGLRAVLRNAGSMSIALKSVLPWRSCTLIFAKTGGPSRRTRNTISMPTGRRTSTVSTVSPVLVHDPDGAAAERDRLRAPSRRPATRSREPAAERRMQVVRDDLRRLGPPRRSGRPPARSRGRRAARPPACCARRTAPCARLAEVLHPPEAALLELGVADREHLVDEQDLRLEVRGDGEREPHVHAARVALDRRVDELLDAGELDDLVELPLRSRGASCRGSSRSGRRSRGRSAPG